VRLLMSFGYSPGQVRSHARACVTSVKPLWRRYRPAPLVMIPLSKTGVVDAEAPAPLAVSAAKGETR
jgi:hypothetical protein